MIFFSVLLLQSRPVHLKKSVIIEAECSCYGDLLQFMEAMMEYKKTPSSTGALSPILAQ